VTTTAGAIRAACCAAIEALTPRSLAGDRFELHRDDQASGQTFEAWLGTTQSQVRRFVMRDVGLRSPPTVSNADVVRERVTFEVVVAYPLSNRYGTDGGRSLEDLVDEDQRQIDHAIGLHGSANVPADAVFLVDQSRWDRVRAETYVFILGTIAFEFWRSAP
jgi:hypothetical protein